MFSITSEREPRYRLLYMSPELMMAGLFKPLEWGGKIQWLTFEGMPPDVEFVAVCWVEERRAFCFRAWHPSFGLVEPCHPIPVLDVRITAHSMPAPGPESLAKRAKERRGPEFL